MQQDDKTVHICHTRLRWYFLLLSVVFPLKHTVQIIKMKPLSEIKQNKTKKSHFCSKQKVNVLHALFLEVVKMLN